MYKRHVFNSAENLEELHPKDSLPTWGMDDLDAMVVYDNDKQGQRRLRNERRILKTLRAGDITWEKNTNFSDHCYLETTFILLVIVITSLLLLHYFITEVIVITSNTIVMIWANNWMLKYLERVRTVYQGLTTKL